jgi:electron transfer flavoprotein beta subunit
MPALQRATAAAISSDGLQYTNVATPKQQRQTRIVKDLPADDIAREIVQWIKQE